VIESRCAKPTWPPSIGSCRRNSAPIARCCSFPVAIKSRKMEGPDQPGGFLGGEHPLRQTVLRGERQVPGLFPDLRPKPSVMRAGEVMATHQSRGGGALAESGAQPGSTCCWPASFAKGTAPGIRGRLGFSFACESVQPARPVSLQRANAGQSVKLESRWHCGMPTPPIRFF